MSGINILNKKFGFNSFGAVAPFVCPDADATAFITTASLTNLTEKQAICQLVQDLKANNLWDALLTIYPMVGGGVLSCSLNLKNVALYNIGWNGLWGFTANGVKPNGINSWANTNLNPASIVGLSTQNISMSYYSRTQSVAAGIDAGSVQLLGMNQRWLNLQIPSDAPNNQYGKDFASASAVGNIASSAAYSLGFSTLTKPKNNVLEVYHNGGLVHSVNVPVPASLPSRNVYLGATNYNGTAAGFGDKECAWFSIGRTLSALENATLYTIVQNFQTTLSRQV
jgi:hypothetical protein